MRKKYYTVVGFLLKKRPILALKILKKLCSENSNTVLFVVGNGPNMQQMKKKLAN